MIDVERAWARVSQTVAVGRKISDFIYQGLVKSFTLTTGQASNNQTVNFAAGAIILGIGAAAGPTAQAATQAAYRPGLDMFSVAIDYQSGGRALVGTDQAIASSVFGPGGDQFPAKEILVGIQGTLLYSLTNLTTSTILVTFTHHCLIPVGTP
jgi:hypothetical protein